MNRRVLARAAIVLMAGAIVFASHRLHAGNGAKKKVVISSEFFREPTSQKDLQELQAVAPSVQLILANDEKEAIAKGKDAEGDIGYCTVGYLKEATKVRWVQVRSAGVNEFLFQNPELMNLLVQRNITMTNGRTLYAPEIADHAMGLLLANTRGIAEFTRRGGKVEWKKSDNPSKNPLAEGIRPIELNGKTMLIIGFGGIGSQIAQRATAFGLKVYATDPKDIPKPSYVEKIAKPSEFHKLLPLADVLVSAVPLTKQTQGMIGKPEFAMMKKGAILINVSRGKVVDTNALVAALKSGKLAATGLDVVDPEPLPLDHPLWKMSNVVISPHVAVQSQNAKKRLFDLVKENLRHFDQGEPLRNVVDKQAGY